MAKTKVEIPLNKVLSLEKAETTAEIPLIRLQMASAREIKAEMSLFQPRGAREGTKEG
ncbi:hypothetical protein [Paenibacillus graminis]|uniref:hypothetical protein n=1 Tax=Paenibacillus graminis TaxID=189425 RepID=UPI002DBB3CC0|nr:hypothetical protein [Paenibacillus graminis]MEC0169752.1 hypothetical protein [Paenibacillus graminis]